MSAWGAIGTRLPTADGVIRAAREVREAREVTELDRAIEAQLARTAVVYSTTTYEVATVSRKVAKVAEYAEMAVRETILPVQDDEFDLNISGRDLLGSASPVLAETLTWWFRTHSYGIEIQSKRMGEENQAPETRPWGEPYVTMILRTR